MKKMVKTQVYLPEEDLRELHRVAKRRRKKVAELVREAVQVTWTARPPRGPIALMDGRLRATSSEHDAAFDEL